MKIGFIGLGTMGSRMAANLQRNGQQLVVFNRTREKADPLIRGGAKWADAPAALGEQSEVLFTMLAHPAAVLESALGENDFSALYAFLEKGG
jgi:3-hydroxyisobutyrate dehydrogenase/glyoxylate/succinic semialdehyde reductase